MCWHPFLSLTISNLLSFQYFLILIPPKSFHYQPISALPISSMFVFSSRLLLSFLQPISTSCASPSLLTPSFLSFIHHIHHLSHPSTLITSLPRPVPLFLRIGFLCLLHALSSLRLYVLPFLNTLFLSILVKPWLDHVTLHSFLFHFIHHPSIPLSSIFPIDFLFSFLFFRTLSL